MAAVFLRRNTDISVRKAENMSVARSVAMSKQTVEKYFTLLDTILTITNCMINLATFIMLMRQGYS
jgi:hypothetical protein